MKSLKNRIKLANKALPQEHPRNLLATAPILKKGGVHQACQKAVIAKRTRRQGKQICRNLAGC